MQRDHKPHIGIYGRCNSGKSTLINLLTSQHSAIVSPEAGTTTDPVRRSMEILDFAPVVLIDTAGLDDMSSLGTVRRQKSVDTLAYIDLAIIVLGPSAWGDVEDTLAESLNQSETPYIIVDNGMGRGEFSATECADAIRIDHLSEDERNAVLEAIKAAIAEKSHITPSLLGPNIGSGDIVLMVCPIDSEAPSGRLILPQVQAIRDALDLRAIAVVVQPSEVAAVLTSGVRPKLVVTDSQVIDDVRRVVPAEIELTSFSILLARMKGDEDEYTRGLEALDTLKCGDRILIAENCTHQQSCEDIGRVKIPRWMTEYTSSELIFDFVSGRDPLPDDLSVYSLIVQCGGCMATRRTIQNRIRRAKSQHVPITNYGMIIKMMKKA